MEAMVYRLLSEDIKLVHLLTLITNHIILILNISQEFNRIQRKTNQLIKTKYC